MHGAAGHAKYCRIVVSGRRVMRASLVLVGICGALPLVSSFAPSGLRIPDAAGLRSRDCSRRQHCSLADVSCLSGAGLGISQHGGNKAKIGLGVRRAVDRTNPLTTVRAVGETDVFDETDLKKMKVLELKEVCKTMGLSTVGKKADLISRLLEAQALTQQYGSGATAGDDDDMDSNDWMAAAHPDDVDSDAPLPVVEDLRHGLGYAPDVPTEASVGGVGRLVTKARTGNCWHGLFFDVTNIGKKTVSIKAIKTGSSPEPPTPVREDRMTVGVYMCEGSAAGKELDDERWTQIGSQRNVQLPVVAYGEPDAYYGALPIGSPIKIAPGDTKGFCIFGDSWRGVVLRAQLGSKFVAGEATDEDANIRLGAGLLPVNDGGFRDGMFTQVYSDSCADAFVGAIEYELE